MQNTAQLLVIQPVNFGFNSETAVNNSFQKNMDGDVQQQALEEFNAFITMLINNKIDLTVIEDSAEPLTPDSIFPNNWISFHDDGRIFLYPMFAVNRRKERKSAVIETIKANFEVKEIIDLSSSEANDLFLEGTGSMVLDRKNKIAYACLSPRTNEKILHEFCSMAGFTPITFKAADSKGNEIYHSNVMMCIADSYAVICLASIANDAGKKELINSLEKTGKEIIDISLEQLEHFAGNMLQVKNMDDEVLLVMSTQAYHALTTVQTATLQEHNRIIHSALNTIETVGGGSARCMLAEIFLQKKPPGKGGPN
jgi:hypothetical protein